MNNSYN